MTKNSKLQAIASIANQKQDFAVAKQEVKDSICKRISEYEGMLAINLDSVFALSNFIDLNNSKEWLEQFGIIEVIDYTEYIWHKGHYERLALEFYDQLIEEIMQDSPAIQRAWSVEDSILTPELIEEIKTEFLPTIELIECPNCNSKNTKEIANNHKQTKNKLEFLETYVCLDCKSCFTE